MTEMVNQDTRKVQSDYLEVAERTKQNIIDAKTINHQMSVSSHHQRSSSAISTLNKKIAVGSKLMTSTAAI